MSARLLRLAACGVLVLLGACTGAPDEPGAATAATDQPGLGVELDAEARQKLGVMLDALRTASWQPSVTGTARVLDAQTAIAPIAALGRAEADARVSRAALTRARDLFKSDTAVSAETLEAAERQAAADEAQLTVARAQAALGFGAAAPWLDPERRAALVTALGGGATLLVSASFPGGLPDARPSMLTLTRLGAGPDAPRWDATDVWPGPADAAVPGPALLALVAAADGLGPGERLAALVPNGAPVDGIEVPASAVVLAGGAAWCYVADGDDLTRRAVDLGRPTAGGYFQSSGFTAGEQVVVAGAGLVLARETGGAPAED